MSILRVLGVVFTAIFLVLAWSVPPPAAPSSVKRDPGLPVAAPAIEQHAQQAAARSAKVDAGMHSAAPIVEPLALKPPGDPAELPAILNTAPAQRQQTAQRNGKAMEAPTDDFSTWTCYCVHPQVEGGPEPTLLLDGAGNILNDAASSIHECTAEEISQVGKTDVLGVVRGFVGCVFSNVCLTWSEFHPVLSIFVPSSAPNGSPRANLTLLPQTIKTHYGNHPSTIAVATGVSHESPLTAMLTNSASSSRSSTVGNDYRVGDTRVLRRPASWVPWTHPNATFESLAVASVATHPFNALHMVQDFFPHLYYLLETMAVPKRLWARMPTFDFYRHNDPRFQRLPEFLNLIKPDAEKVCFQRPVLLSPAWLEGHTFVPVRRRYREHVLRTYIGDTDYDRLANATCRIDYQPTILYVSRKGGSRGLVNEADLYRYLDVLEQHGGAKVLRVQYEYGVVSWAEQMRTAASANIMILPHGAAMLHSFWMPLACGQVAELYNCRKNALYGSQYMRRITQHYGKVMPLMWYNPASHTTDVDFAAPLQFDAKSFHFEFGKFLVTNPRSQRIRDFGRRLLHMNV
jgi:hypothetical protein